ncbi:MAG: DMT family transporter [Pseudooceanicola sp.]|nr:DMT family transporter [Pseudooceanicola sp.]
MADQRILTPRASAELLLLGLIWGGVFLSVRLTLDAVPLVTAVLHRTFWAMLVLWGVVLWLRLPLPGLATWGAFLVMGLLNNVIPFGLIAWGQLHIESGLTSILNATTAVFGVIVAALVFADERLTPRRMLGVGLGFAGVVTAIGPGALAGFDLRSAAQLAVLGGTLSYALAGAWARRTLSHLPAPVAAAGMLTASTLMLAPAALLIDGAPDLALPLRTWGAIAYSSVIATAGAYLLYYRVLAMAGSGNLMLVTLLIPPVAIVLGALVLGEALHPSAYAGFALLALGLVILNRRPARPIDPVPAAR